jgi:photosystem II stability/assembly factor-like uncharacterized protein
MKRSILLATVLVSCMSLATSAQQVQSMKLLSLQVGWAWSGNHLYWTNDSGGHWKDISPHMSFETGVADVFFLDMSAGWMLLSSGNNDADEPDFDLASTTDGGNQWRINRIRIPHLNSREVALTGQGTLDFVDRMHGWMNLAVVSGSAFRSSILLMTKDGGTTWDWAPGGSCAGGGTVRFVTQTDGWVAGGPGDEHLCVTRDGAKSWQEITLQAPAGVLPANVPAYEAPVFSGPKNGLLGVTYSGPERTKAALVLFATEDGGRSWKPDRILPMPDVLAGGERIPSAVVNSVLLASSRSSSTGTMPLTIAPPGTKASTTIARVSSRALAVFELSFADISHGWASTSLGLLSTADGGVTWTDITPSTSAIRGSRSPTGRSLTFQRPRTGVSAPHGLERCHAIAWI